MPRRHTGLLLVLLLSPLAVHQPPPKGVASAAAGAQPSQMSSPEVRALLDLGKTAEKQDRWGEAERLYQAALERARQLNDRTGEATSLQFLGDGFANNRRPLPALACYQQALVLMRAVGDKRSEAITLRN